MKTQNSKKSPLHGAKIILLLLFVTVSMCLPFSGSAEETTSKATQPVINIPIPTLPSLTEVQVAPGQAFSAPWIAEYLVGVYKYAIMLGAIIAVLVMMAGGLMYVTSAANANNIKKAQSMIGGAVFGLVVLIMSYMVLGVINPNLNEQKALVMETVEEVLLDNVLLEAETSSADQQYALAVGAGKPDSGILPGTFGEGYLGFEGYAYGPDKDAECISDYFFNGILTYGTKASKYSTKITAFGLDKFSELSTPELEVLPQKFIKRRKGNAKKDRKPLTKEEHRAYKLKKITDASKTGGFKFYSHKKSIPGYANFTMALMMSPDPEVKGYLQYMWDYAAGKVPNLQGEFGPDGIASSNLSSQGAGFKRKGPKGVRQASPVWDPHTLGLATDFMTESNNMNKSTKCGYKSKGKWKSCAGGASKKVCATYKDTLDKMKSGYYGDFFKNDPYQMYDRMDTRLDLCLNGSSPVWSFPNGWVDIAMENDFWPAIWGWGNPYRSDAMHHEFYGPCFSLKVKKLKPDVYGP
ncbi:hypothetical protein HN858_04070 [Candidatus Falkowbacteria bacterium]|jgi:hypothetical protein|nr:hypothetical protein [Candidatus Falkowbacteria bacterium]MBT5503173.1 hypothetical protein [Candidatus Falkowbacteria bacterium]MBT6574561.1 hypothetical protein [Candidatus Falkowbacteria bacterium]MBT7348824.1 hypothetical protein [Candidatus Falkowbacteria bacterium]MBT7500862.1 hypothetical protein [Candidatus Falkowbacteria bacterium]